MKKGMVFNIQKFCTDDGPGIRTTVFLKGCHLRCRWCHNAESYVITPILSFNANKCIHCSLCKKICKNGVHTLIQKDHSIQRNSCDVCGQCVNACPVGALKITGMEMSVDEVLAEVIKDIAFFRQSGGGVTFSGGEPLVQMEFLQELLAACKAEKLHTAIETSGAVRWEKIEPLLPDVDLWLYDIKETNHRLMQENTGGSLTLILQNLEKLCRSKAAILVRCPIIPGINDRDDHFSNLRQLKRQFPQIMDMQIMPYHGTGEHKKEEHGIPSEYFSSPTWDDIESWKRRVSCCTKLE